MKNQKINNGAVWLMIVFFQLFPMLWYSPYLLGNTWMRVQGYTMDDFKGDENVSGIIFSIIGAVIFNYFLAWLFIKLKISTVLGAIKIGGMLFLGCFFFITLTQNTFSMRPLALSLINGGVELVLFITAAIVLFSWKKYKTA